MRLDPVLSVITDRSTRNGVPAGVVGFLSILSAVAVMLPRIEGFAAPIVSQKSIEDITRLDGQLCWRRLSYKYRVVPIEDYDVVLIRPVVRYGKLTVVRSFPEVYFGDGEGAGEPVTSEVRNGVGWSRRKYCTQIPIGVKPEQTITVKVTIVYRGLWGLWNVPVRGLDVVSEGVSSPDTDAPL